MENSAISWSLFVFLGAFSVEGVRIDPPLPRNLFPFIGSEVHNTCHFIGENGQPPLWVKFQKTKKKKEPQNWMNIANTERVYQTNATHGDKTSVTLNIKNVTSEDDTWTYSCVGFHASDSKQIFRLEFAFIVMYKEDLPIAGVVPNHTVSFAETVNFYCSLTHKNNEAKVTIERATFIKNGIPLMSTNDLTQPLVVGNVTGRDGGNYACLLSVKFHKEQTYSITPVSNAYLHVRARFPRNESKVDARVGEDIALNCSAEGYPLNITWKKSKSGLSSVIKATDRFKLEQQCLYCPSILFIQNFSVEDCGEYSCSALGFPGKQVFHVVFKGDQASTPSTVTTAVSPAAGMTAISSSASYLAAFFFAFLKIWGTV